jgi:pre-mRNA-processing factor SLU7
VAPPRPPPPPPGPPPAAGAHVRLDPTKLAEALRREDARLREGERDGGDERKRGFNVTHEEDVTEEEMEAFRMKRQRKEDPMAAKDAGTEGYDLV